MATANDVINLLIDHYEILFLTFFYTSKHVRALQRENNLLYCRWHEHGCTVELCVDIAATVACVPSVTAHGEATYDSGAPAIEKTWASIA